MHEHAGPPCWRRSPVHGDLEHFETSEVSEGRVWRCKVVMDLKQVHGMHHGVWNIISPIIKAMEPKICVRRDSNPSD